MDEKQKFEFLMKDKQEEEKDYFFFNDDDEEKITFNNYRRNVEGDLDMFGDLEEDCSDCDKDCKSKILADLPTNDSNSYIFEHEAEEKEATKFLTRLGLLERVDDNDIFAIEEHDNSLKLRAHDDFELYSPGWRMLLPQNANQNEDKLFITPFSENDCGNELSQKEKELLVEGLPILQIDDDVETFHEPGSNSCTQHQDKTTLSESGEPSVKVTQDVEEVIDTTPVPSRKKTTEFNHLLERKTFRMLRKYYKWTFEKFATPFQYKKKVKTMSPEEMDQLVLSYMKVEFDFLIGLLAANELIQMITCLKRIILSDRFNKGERVTTRIDFTTTRNLFNKYSTRALNEFINIPANSILFIHFYLKEGRTLSHTQRDVDQQKLEKQMRCLIKVAFNYLPPNFREIYSHANWQLINFLN